MTAEKMNRPKPFKATVACFECKDVMEREKYIDQLEAELKTYRTRPYEEIAKESGLRDPK